MKDYVLAIDLGATSGRMILSGLENGVLTTEEVRRFPNAIHEKDGKFYWSIETLFGEIVAGLNDLALRRDVHIRSIGVDTWGVDVAFIGADGKMISEPRAYRDPYTDTAIDELSRIIPKETIYKKTGIQFLNFNTLFQLYACHKEGFEPMKQAKTYLFIPDLISYLLTGKAVCEYTILSTSQFLDPVSKQIDRELIEAVGADINAFPPIVMPGEEIGKLRTELLQHQFGYDIPVIAIAGHDTASAVASVPAANEKFAYLSSGTWSLMGIEGKHPIITDRSAELNFTNEGGIEGTTRFLKNITGMWILEQCRKEWKAAGKDYSYPELVEMELSAPAFHSFFNTDDPIFANPPSMLAAIDEYCEKHGIAKPENDAQVARSIMESLALRYRTVFTWLKEVAPFPIEVLHIIGGGAKNALLDQFTANAIGATVLAGPTEATAIGNIMMQFKAIGLVKDIREMRALIAKATPLDRFEPKETEAWNKAYAEFCQKCY
jgi:rhamnulokinase